MSSAALKHFINVQCNLKENRLQQNIHTEILLDLLFSFNISSNHIHTAFIEPLSWSKLIICLS